MDSTSPTNPPNMQKRTWLRHISALTFLAMLISAPFFAPWQPNATVAQQTPQATATLSFPDGFMKSVKDYGAKGDGVTDDTAAIQQALADGRDKDQDYFGRPKALYFPAGTYLVNNTLDWRGCCVTLQGQGPDASVIKLKDGAPGFGDPNAPRPVIKSPQGNMSFRQNVWDLSIDTGKNNPGAAGLDYIANNSGAVRNVSIVSGDGKGKAGLDMSRQWPGPLLIKNLSVTGFDYGILVGHAEYGPTFENITLRNQNVAGIFNVGNTLAIRGFDSANSVPAIKTDKDWSSVIVLDGNFQGGAASTSAIDSTGYLYARNITAAGYQSAIRHKGAVVPGMTQSEYIAGKVYSLFDSPQRSLNLPIAETPEFVDNNPANWGKFTTSHYGDTSKLQELLNSGKSTIYFPMSAYFSYDERAVTVPPTVRRIIGFSSVVNSDAKGKNGGGIKFVVDQNSDQPLIIEQFGYGVKVEHTSARPVAIKHGKYDYTSKPGAGNLFLEDTEVHQNFVIQPGQRVWARQWNNEHAPGPKIRNDGGALWLFGIKTERAGTVIETVNGGKSELLGTLIYPAKNLSAEEKQESAFISREASMSLIYSVSSYLPDGNYPIQIEETRSGVTKKLPASDVSGRIPLFTGFTEQAGGQNAAPSVSVTSPANGASVAPGATVPITANANDTDGNVTKVEFFRGATKLGEDVTAPYCFAWSNATAGAHSLTAKATDNGGATATSAAVNITVGAQQGQQQPPVGSFRTYLALVFRGGAPGGEAGGC